MSRGVRFYEYGTLMYQVPFPDGSARVCAVRSAIPSTVSSGRGPDYGRDFAVSAYRTGTDLSHSFQQGGLTDVFQ